MEGRPILGRDLKLESESFAGVRLDSRGGAKGPEGKEQTTLRRSGRCLHRWTRLGPGKVSRRACSDVALRSGVPRQALLRAIFRRIRDIDRNAGGGEGRMPMQKPSPEEEDGWDETPAPGVDLRGRLINDKK